jgi:hypothetical protein
VMGQHRAIGLMTDANGVHTGPISASTTPV